MSRQFSRKIKRFIKKTVVGAALLTTTHISVAQADSGPGALQSWEQACRSYRTAPGTRACAGEGGHLAAGSYVANDNALWQCRDGEKDQWGHTVTWVADRSQLDSRCPDIDPCYDVGLMNSARAGAEMTTECAEYMWADAGCTTSRDQSGWAQWAAHHNLQLNQLTHDFNLWSTLKSEVHVNGCQSAVQTGACTDVTSAANMTEACADQMWSGAGCTTEKDHTGWRNWAKDRNLSLLDLKRDFYAWSTSLAPHHVEACQSPYQRPDLAQERARAENGDAPSPQSTRQAAGGTAESSGNIARFSAASGSADIAVIGGEANWKITLPNYKFIRSAVFSNASEIRNFDLIMLDERGAEVRRISGLNTAGETQFTLDVDSSEAQEGSTGTPLDTLVIGYAKEIQIEASGSVKDLIVAFDLAERQTIIDQLKAGLQQENAQSKSALKSAMSRAQEAQAASEAQAAQGAMFAQEYVPLSIQGRVTARDVSTNSAGESIADFHMPPSTTKFPSTMPPDP